MLLPMPVPALSPREIKPSLPWHRHQIPMGVKGIAFESCPKLSFFVVNIWKVNWWLKFKIVLKNNWRMVL